MTETVAEIVAAHRAGITSPAKTVARSFQRIRDYGDPAIFISLRIEAEAIAEAEALAAKGDTSLPLYGVPVAVKDNIDVAAFRPRPPARRSRIGPRRDANTVARLRAAGAIVIGQDQSRSVRDRAGRCALALRHSEERSERRPRARWIKFGIGSCGLRRSCAAVARHRHCGLGPRAGDAQQHRWP